MNYPKSFLLYIALFSSFQAYSQNGWVKEAKEYYGQLSFSTFSTNEFYSTTGTLFDSGSDFSSRGAQFYGEYGLTDRFTVVLDAPIVINQFSTTESVTGLGSIKVGLKYGLLKSLPVSLQIDAEIPTDDGINFANALTPNALGFVEQINLPTSDGEFNFWTTLAASRATKDGNTFGSVFLSLNLRTEGFSHQIQSGVEVGHLLFDRLYLIGKLKFQEKLSTDAGPNASFLFGEGTTYTTYSFVPMYKLNDHWSLVASVTDYSDFIAKRRNVYDGISYSFGIVLENL